MDLILLISQLTQNTWFAPSSHQRLLHSWRSTNKHFRIFRPRRRRHSTLQQLLGHITLSICRPRDRVTNGVDDLEAVRKQTLQLFELGLQQNIRVRVDTEHERNTRLVIRVAQYALDQLIHGRDTGTSRNKCDIGVFVSCPFISRYRRHEA